MGDALAMQLADARLFIFLGVFLLLACLERVMPFRDYSQTKGRRWSTNIALSIMSTLILRAVPAFAAGVAAVFASNHSFGLLHTIETPDIAGIILTLFILDFIIYLQHVLTHKVNFLWAIHQVHHSDKDFDITTGIRFHPVEIVFSMGIKCSAVIALGAPLLGVIVFEILLSACSLFTHTNISFSEKLDRVLRYFLVTPNMHRIHHSVDRKEHDSNYGTCISIWDRICRTYTASAAQNPSIMEIGLSPYKHKNTNRFSWVLLLPFMNR